MGAAGMPPMNPRIPPQGHIWHGGFASGALQAKMYPDVAPALALWHSMGIKTYIYSSGSRCSQLKGLC